MFEVGKFYRVKMWEDSDTGGTVTEYPAAKVVEVSLPLVRFINGPSMGSGEIILNTASLAFVSAAVAHHEIKHGASEVDLASGTAGAGPVIGSADAS